MARLPFPLNTANTVVLVSIVLFLLVPFLQSSGLSTVVDSLLGRVMLVGFVLYGITLGPLAGVFSFLAVAAIFAERNRYSILITQKSIISRGSVPTLGQVDMPHSMPAPTRKQPADEPWLKYEHTGSFMEGDGWNGPVGETEDAKHVLQSQLYPNDRQDRFYVDTGLAPADPHA
jgi:hypothetical protein